MTPGIHLIHKPPGPSSFSVLRQHVGDSRLKTCHGGALDPFAGGLLLVLVEPATKLFDYLHAIPKTYEATIRWGVETDNGDALGRVTFEGDPASLTPAKLDEALTHFIGWHEQVPPATSNKRIGGERAYLKAHRGEAFDLPPAQVYLHEATWLDHDLPRHSRLRLIVRGGYYVRSLARDLGRILGCGAHLTALHRTSIGPWQDPGEGGHVELHGRAIMPWAPWRILTDQEVGALRRAQTIPLGEILPPESSLPIGFPDPQPPIRGFHLERFAFLLRREADRLAAVTPLPGSM